MPKKKRNSVSFIVRGWGHFPTDMLRYDRCWPRRERDIDKMLHNPGIDPETRKPVYRSVELTSESQMAPTKRRWASFGWSVQAQEDNHY